MRPRAPCPPPAPAAAAPAPALARRLTSAALAALLATAAPSLVAPPPPAYASPSHLVRVEDVDSPALRAGLNAANERRFGDALSAFEGALADDGPSAALLSNLGNVRLSLGDPDAALASFDEALTLAPAADSAILRLNRALAHEALAVRAAAAGDAAAAAASLAAGVADCDAAIAADPGEAAAHYNRGGLLQRGGDFAGAAASFRTAADLAPGLPGYRARHAVLLLQLGDPAAAAKELRAVVRRTPIFAEAHAALAGVEWARGDGARAEGELEAAAALDSGWKAAGRAAGAARWPPALVAAYEKLLALEPMMGGGRGRGEGELLRARRDESVVVPPLTLRPAAGPGSALVGDAAAPRDARGATAAGCGGRAHGSACGRALQSAPVPAPGGGPHV